MPHLGEKIDYVPGRGSPRAVTPSGTGYVFTAPSNGLIAISGGTVSLVEYGRGNTFFVAGLISGPVFMAAGDKIRLTYLLAPAITFLPM